MNNNLCSTVIKSGGTVIPILPSSRSTEGLGIMNPSIYADKEGLLLNLRNVNYTLYHCENEQLFNNRHGPLVYLHPENDIHLRTKNFMCLLDDNLGIKSYYKVDTTKFDVTPIWEFVGLEDVRLVRWDDRLFMCGVRRDTKTDGEGRMEMSEIVINIPNVDEIARYRIEPPKWSYCEKNWMPILDMPFHFVKWTNPTEVVKVNIETLTSETVFLCNDIIEGLPDLRGSSQVISYNDNYMCLVHCCDLFKNKLMQKDAKYTHWFITWNKNWDIINVSEPFSFMDGEIEFCCGLAIHNGDMLISFGFQDNAAYILKIPLEKINTILHELNTR